MNDQLGSGRASTTVDDLWSPAAAARCGLTVGAAWAVSGMGHLLGYARVSISDQQPQLQVDALERAGCYRVVSETARRPRRPPIGAPCR